MRPGLVKAILLIFIIQLLFSTTGRGQSIMTEKVKIGLEDESLQAAIKKIEQQSVFRFFYRDADIAQLKHLNLKTETRTIEQTLVALLENTELHFRQLDHDILLERTYRQAFQPLPTFEITGRVIDSANKKPIANASVFFSNSTTGTVTDTNGGFKLNLSKGGKYQITVSMLGYTAYQNALLVEKENINLGDIRIRPKVIALSQVDVKTTGGHNIPDPHWDRDYRWFREEFLGSSGFADKCKILNPAVLNLSYNDDNAVLTASTSDLLEINNYALGYKLKYLLTEFTSNRNSGKVTYKGSVLFEPINGDESEQAKRKKNRSKAYKGSVMHFLRAVIENQLLEQGFRVLTLKKKTVPDYPNTIIDSLGTTPLKADDFVKLSDKKGIYALSFKDCLYIMYTKIHNYTGNLPDIPPASQRDYAKTTITMTAPYVFFDENGIIINPEDMTKEGYWARSRVADLLPSDYVPEN